MTPAECWVPSGRSAPRTPPGSNSHCESCRRSRERSPAQRGTSCCSARGVQRCRARPAHLPFCTTACVCACARAAPKRGARALWIPRVRASSPEQALPASGSNASRVRPRRQHPPAARSGVGRRHPQSCTDQGVPSRCRPQSSSRRHPCPSHPPRSQPRFAAPLPRSSLEVCPGWPRPSPRPPPPTLPRSATLLPRCSHEARPGWPRCSRRPLPPHPRSLPLRRRRQHRRRRPARCPAPPPCLRRPVAPGRRARPCPTRPRARAWRRSSAGPGGRRP